MSDKMYSHFNDDLASITITSMTLQDIDICDEARRWVTGKRGAAVNDTDSLRLADLTEFIRETIRIGALMLNTIGADQERRAREQMLAEATDKATQAIVAAGESIGRAIEEATRPSDSSQE